MVDDKPQEQRGSWYGKSVNKLKYTFTVKSEKDCIRAKRNIFVDTLLHKLEQFSEDVVKQDVGECNNSRLIKKAAQYFPMRADLRGIPLDTNQILCFSNIFREVEKPIELLDLINCQLGTSAFRQICTAMKATKTLVKMLHVVYNNLSSASVDDICGILHKVSSVFWMDRTFSDGLGLRYATEEEEEKIRQALDLIQDTVSGDPVLKVASLEVENLFKILTSPAGPDLDHESPWAIPFVRLIPRVAIGLNSKIRTTRKRKTNNILNSAQREKATTVPKKTKKNKTLSACS
ncbi:unnamed protein product [Clavelina lepadiformis]|uniref:Uncharacterized protein n=1 Tax=Clavelina lepadiformis TaxID=159417 RepID=A0ABP0GWD7_CLALP